MAEDDWMNAGAEIPASKFQDEDKPAEKKEIKVYFPIHNYFKERRREKACSTKKENY